MTNEKEVFSSDEYPLFDPFDDSKHFELERKLIAREISIKEYCKEITGEYPSDEKLKEYAKNHPEFLAE